VLLFFYVALLPVVNLGIARPIPGLERFIYWPSVFAVIFIVYLLYHLFDRLRSTVIACSILVVLSIPLLYRSSDAWRYTGDFSLGLAHCLSDHQSLITKQTFPEYYFQCIRDVRDKNVSAIKDRLALTAHVPPLDVIECLKERKDCPARSSIPEDLAARWIRAIPENRN
jgi:hypothetical protein